MNVPLQSSQHRTEIGSGSNAVLESPQIVVLVVLFLGKQPGINRYLLRLESSILAFAECHSKWRPVLFTSFKNMNGSMMIERRRT